MQRIEADVLVPGLGKPIKNGCVVIEGSSIAYAGAVEGAPKAGKGAPTVGVPAVMPGMWETHGHFMGILTGNLEEEIPRTPTAVSGARIAKDAEKALLAGFTSVREVGGLGVHLARAIDEGTVLGPHIYAAGSALSQTGGHGDFHSLPLSLVTDLSAVAGMTVLCDGVPECLKGVRSQLRLGAKVIKVLASGGIMSMLDSPVHQQFSDEELRAIVQEAGRADRVVAAHCHGKPGIMAALRAGCRTIEHGTYLDDEAADVMIENHAVLVPTRFIIERLLKYAKEAKVPDYAYAKLVGVHGQHAKALRLAIKKGLTIAVGTDIWTSGRDTPFRWGLNAFELVHLTAAGMTPLKAIQAATANGPLTLGPQAPKSGQLKAGYDADLLALSKNPETDIEVLTNPDSITHVWKSGQLVKGSSAAM